MGVSAFANQFSGFELSVTIPSSLKEIPEWAFSNIKLAKLIIENGVTSICMNSFDGHSLKQLIILDSITKIGDQTFKSDD